MTHTHTLCLRPSQNNAAYLLVSGQMDNQIVVSDYAQMDRVLREERAYILNLVKQIKKAGCNVLLIQKSILRYGKKRIERENASSLV